MDKRIRSDLFRERLQKAMASKHLSQSKLAQSAGVDRSTISALLADGTRLPNAQLIADCALALGVTSDWLLGLSETPDTVNSILDQYVRFDDAPRALLDDTMFSWHKEAAGYKIRHVPATLPDMLKLPEVVSWEYRDHLKSQDSVALASFQAQLDWMRGARSDYEIALPVHELHSFAHGTGYWQDLPLSLRRAQLLHLATACEDLYPALRLYIFDAHKVFSSPVTVFGPGLAVLYLGRSYVSFRDPSKVQLILRHFDWLVREASFGARDVAQHIRALL